MPRTNPVVDLQVVEDADGRFVVETLRDGTIVRRRVVKDAKPKRKPRKPFARAWRPNVKPTT